METAFRRIFRVSKIALIIASALVEYAVAGWWRRGVHRARHQARWLHRHTKRAVRVLHLRVTVRGLWRNAPLIATNHVSYVDILTLASIAPVRFVAKEEVRRWPVFGWLARCAGTIFVSRERHRSLSSVNNGLRTAAEQEVGIVVFPEATSSDGTSVLSFRSSLFEVAAERAQAVLPVWIGYAVDGADAARDVCWWGDMTLLPHVWRLLGLKEIHVTVRVGNPVQHTDRKSLAAQLHQAVCHLASTNAVWRDRLPLSEAEVVQAD